MGLFGPVLTLLPVQVQGKEVGEGLLEIGSGKRSSVKDPLLPAASLAYDTSSLPVFAPCFYSTLQVPPPPLLSPDLLQQAGTPMMAGVPPAKGYLASCFMGDAHRFTEASVVAGASPPLDSEGGIGL